MGKLRNLEDLLEFEVKDLYDAEKQLIEALPRMSDKAHDMQLKQALENHLQETRSQLLRLEKIFQILNWENSYKICEPMKGMIEEGQNIIHEEATPETKDAGLIATAQKIEHYEISGYGTAAHFAERLGLTEVYSLLSESLVEEQRADTLLNDLAKNYINAKAMV